MQKGMFRKGLVLGIIALFIGVGVIPSISGNINRNDKLDPGEHIGDVTDGWLIDERSTTGPTPPINCDMGLNPSLLTGKTVIAGVPAYIWRHGCGPTAAGMVIGYWDGYGYEDLIPGDASFQTKAVNQVIASGGKSSDPNPPGSEQHYEDYARPEDSPPNLLNDDYITQGRTPHSNDCIADYMKTSRSSWNNYYGRSRFSDVDDALLDYINWVNPHYKVSVNNLYWGELTWDNFCKEIDANRPVILLVDVDGDGNADHLVTAIGYDDSQNYACYDTWHIKARWYDFSKITSGNPWGIYGATFCVFHGITITRPNASFYLFNRDIMESFKNYQWPFSKPLIIGPIDIEVQSSDNEFVIDRVEFYIDKNLEYNTTSKPYSWTWKRRGFIRHRLTITVVAYDYANNSASNELVVLRFL